MLVVLIFVILWPHSLKLYLLFQRMALVGLLQRTGLDPALIDYVCVGTVIQEVKYLAMLRTGAERLSFAGTFPMNLLFCVLGKDLQYCT